MNILSNQHFHVGAYGVLIQDNKILLIKKSRGAYKGKFDLPGGGIEFGEKAEEALKREFIEETGITLSNYSFVGYNEYFSDYFNESGESRQLHHLGLYYIVSGSFDEIKSDSDGQDSLGAEFVDINNLDKIKVSPIALKIIKKVLDSAKKDR